MRLTRFIAIGIGFLLAGCVSGPKSLYAWGDYQPALLSYAKHPEEGAKFAERLKVVIDKAEIENKVPPGLYAEYGYALVELNRTPEAIDYFGKEAARWPESTVLMNRLMTRLAKTQTAPAATPAVGGGTTPVVPTPVVPATNPSR